MSVDQDFQKNQDITEDNETSFLEFWILALTFILLVGFLANASVKKSQQEVGTQDTQKIHADLGINISPQTEYNETQY